MSLLPKLPRDESYIQNKVSILTIKTRPWQVIIISFWRKISTYADGQDQPSNRDLWLAMAHKEIYGEIPSFILLQGQGMSIPRSSFRGLQQQLSSFQLSYETVIWNTDTLKNNFRKWWKRLVSRLAGRQKKQMQTGSYGTVTDICTDAVTNHWCSNPPLCTDGDWPTIRTTKSFQRTDKMVLKIGTSYQFTSKYNC